MHRRAAMTVLLAVAVAGPAAPALADHTDPGDRLSPIAPNLPAELAVTSGEGEWQHLANVGPMQGTDLEFFTKDGATFVSGGTLGQIEDDLGDLPTGTTGFIGQRILRLTDGSGTVLEEPEVVADHGSAVCTTNSSATGLQHDVQAVPLEDASILVDTTDAVGRCHDAAGGGLEIIDVSGLGQEGFEVRELGLIRFNGLSHTVTADRDRPGILYNNGADFNAQTWIDVVDVRTCLFDADDTATLDQRRAACQPEVYRMLWEPEWAFKAPPGEEPFEASNCHDITYSDDRLYCAGLNATLLFDVSGMFDENGDVRGEPLPCEGGVAGTNETGALVTDCALRPADATSANPSVDDAIEAYEAAGSPQAEGWEFLGSVNHVGRACPESDVVTCNTNLAVPATEDVAVSHEADPSHDGRFMFVTDERGGGVVPPGATCAPSLDNPVGNGGIHAYDISSLSPGSDPQHARTPEGDKAVYIGGSPTPSAAFCTVHVIERMPDEQRLSVAYYDGGTKIVDYFVNPDGTFEWKETASYRLPGANTWASEVFSTQDNADGTRTYWFVSTSFALGSGTARGFDLFTWTGPTNPIGAQSPTTGGGGGSAANDDGPGTVARALPATGADAAVLALVLVLIPAAVAVRVLRRRLGAAQAG